MNFEIEVDDQARAWMDAHPATRPRAITYDWYRCCGGTKVCSVAVQPLSRRDHAEDYISARLPDGSELLVDPRAAKRLPARFRLTVRGVGPFKHLDLALSGEEWGDLLYT